MFNIGFTEMLVLAGLALILIGPKQLPEVARTLGRFINEIKRSTESITDEFRSARDEFKYEELPPHEPVNTKVDDLVSAAEESSKAEEGDSGKIKNEST